MVGDESDWVRETQCLRMSFASRRKTCSYYKYRSRIENISVAINSGEHSRNINNITSPFPESLTFTPLNLRWKLFTQIMATNKHITT